MRRRFFGSQTSLSYMTIEAVEYTTVEFPGKIEYSFDDGNTWKEGKYQDILHLQPGTTVYFRNMVRNMNTGNLGSFIILGSCNLTGNCMSLIPDGKLYDQAFKELFEHCVGIISVSEDFLPATTLASSCYNSMFSGCTSLTTAPALPATTLTNNCYGFMFYNCSKLNYIKMLATDISASSCLYGWVSGVSSTGTFVKNPAMTTLPTGNKGIPSGWTVYNDGEENSGGNNEITFYIDDQAADVIPMKALPNMTWEEFVNSEYANQNSMFTNFRLTDMGAYKAIKFYYEPAMDNLTLYNNVSNYSTVMHYDIIENGKIYYAYF